MNKKDFETIMRVRGRNALYRNIADATNDLMAFYKKYRTTLPILNAFGFCEQTENIEMYLAELLETFNNLRSEVWQDFTP